MTVQALSVVAGPNFLRQISAANGIPTPVIDFPAHIIPYANPFRRTNHSSRYSVVGVKSSPHPRAEITPCVAINCHTVLEKLDNRKPITVNTKPMGPNQRRRRGQRVRIAKLKGDMRYMIPSEPISSSR